MSGRLVRPLRPAQPSSLSIAALAMLHSVPARWQRHRLGSCAMDESRMQTEYEAA